MMIFLKISVNLKEYCKFFLLEDLIDDTFSKVNFIYFKQFGKHALPGFINARSLRMEEYVKTHDFK